MIDFEVTPASVRALERSFADQRTQLVAAVRQGMQEAMVRLAVDASQAAPKRTGRLAANIVTSARVKDTATEIIGTVSGDVGRKHVALWQEAGIKEPEVTMRPGKFMRAMIEEKAIFFRHRRAFMVPGRPFMNPTLQRDKAMIFDVIREHVLMAVKIQTLVGGYLGK